MATNEEVLAEIKKSREINDDQHDKILDSAEKTEELTKLIQGGLRAWQGFKTVMYGIRSFIFLLGGIYLVFKESIHKMFGE